MDAAAAEPPIPTASRRDGATTPPLQADDAPLRLPQLPHKPPKPYSKSQVAFLELYNMLIQPANPQPLFASIDKLLNAGAADGVYAADGTTLMHAAAMYASQMAEGANQIMRALVRAKPEQAYIASKSLGYLPLHYAACNAAPLDVIQTLFEAHPQAYTTTEKKGLTPPSLADKMGHKEISRVLGRMWERERRTAKMAGGTGGRAGEVDS
jgi:ankyrin repeat protein